MTFRLHHSVVLDAPQAVVWDLLSSPEHLPRLQEALPDCKKCTVTAIPSGIDATPLHLSVSSCRDALYSQTMLDLSWPDIDVSPHAVHFSFKLGLATVIGAQVTTEGCVVLFHSRVSAAGIEEHKLRLVQGVGDGQTRVTETVWGKAPAPLAWMLNMTGMAAKTHRQHMDAYNSLLER